MKKHLKRIAAPKTWAVKRKSSKFITRPLPGKHKQEAGMPITTVLRSMLGHAGTAKEARDVIKNKDVILDGKRVWEERQIVGVMDSIKIPETKESYRMLIGANGKLMLKEISQSEADTKICRIDRKSMIKGGKIQLGLHDGRAIIIGENKYKRGDSLLIRLPKQEIEGHLPLEKNAQVYLIGGKHRGATGTIEEIGLQKLSVKIGEDIIETLKKFVFVVK